MQQELDGTANRKTNPHRHFYTYITVPFITLPTPPPDTYKHTHTYTVFAFGHRQFDTTGVPRAMWMSVCLLESLWFFVRFLYVIVTADHITAM